MKTLAGLSSEKASCSKMDSVPSFLQYLPPTPLTKSEQIGEFLHVIRPLLHGRSQIILCHCLANGALWWFPLLGAVLVVGYITQLALKSRAMI